MTPHPRPTAHRALRASLLALGAALLLFAVPSTAVSDNQGTIKVHNPNSIGDESNDPHVDCSFYVEGFNMEASSGTLVIKSWPPTGDMSVVLSTTYAKDDDEDEGHHFLNGPYQLPDGHYKVFVSDTHHDKMKVFWVDCEESTTTTQPGTSTTAQVPFFPSAMAVGLGLVGALGGAILLLRRRM